MIKCECKNCSSRYVGCHSACESYLRFSRKQSEEREYRHEQKALYNYLVAQSLHLGIKYKK